AVGGGIDRRAVSRGPGVGAVGRQHALADHGIHDADHHTDGACAGDPLGIRIAVAARPVQQSAATRRRPAHAVSAAGDDIRADTAADLSYAGVIGHGAGDLRRLRGAGAVRGRVRKALAQSALTPRPAALLIASATQLAIAYLLPPFTARLHLHTLALRRLLVLALALLILLRRLVLLLLLGRCRLLLARCLLPAAAILSRVELAT